MNTIIKIKKLMFEKNITPDVIHDKFGNSADMSQEELEQVVKWLEEK